MNDDTSTPRVPGWVWLVGLLAAAVHIAPYLVARAGTPDGWTFTANLSVSPDYMQYRVWERQTPSEGVFVSNRFTPEPNPPHLPVLPYWVVGQLSAWTGISPEWTYAWLGSLLALLFAPLLYHAVRRFSPSQAAVPWVFGALLVGGGLGGYIKFLEDIPWVRGNYLLDSLLIQPFAGDGRAVLFENYRGNYVVQALFDTHFLLYWLVTLIAVLALWQALSRFSWLRLALAALLFGVGTWLHVYEGLTLLVIAAGVCAAVWRKGVPLRTALTTLVACGAAVFAVLVPLAVIYKSSGLPAPEWRGLTVEFSVLVLAYPVAWLLIVPGLAKFWREGGLEAAFLVGWGTALLLLTLSGPIFPYPDRGTMTLQIPLMIVAGAVFFARRARPGWMAIVLLLLLAGSTPAFIADSWIDRTRFTDDQPHKYLSDAHLEIIGVLREQAGPRDVLVADQPPLRWLAPDYPGVHYAGHFFLTPNFTLRRDSLAGFWRAPPDEQAVFLRRRGARWLFVDAAQQPSRFEQVPHLRAVHGAPFGTLFIFEPAGGS
ncbi:MAG: hypothetical protein L0271_25915 [Gemmatimonadetes bacterium]|nr:hypothetical protein [Gemmatimonadota bacterium]